MTVPSMTSNPNVSLAIGRFSKNSDLLMAMSAVVIIGLMVIPMPPSFLDLLLTVNISGSLMIFLATIYAKESLEFSSFPALLLLATLFRLALSISATRLILLHGHAGAMISAFGNFVVGGNYVVGLVIFLLLIIIQFVVITNGAGRVAEVAARFTLDAMPGKQMAIDADLNAGMINEAQARERRIKIAKEADFYGAMDGASKFVRGDAIAAIVMILINILGGFIVGVVQQGMEFNQALQTYTLLTVGEGLVAQIPALLVSTATGLLVTRTGSDNNLGGDLSGQIFAKPRASAVAAATVFLLGFVPGLPKITFWFVASCLAMMYMILQEKAVPALKELGDEKAAPVKAPESDDMTHLLSTDTLEVEIGYGLVLFADPKQGGELLDRITLLRKQIASDVGIIIPPVRVRDNLRLGPNDYSIKLRGAEIAHGEIYPGQTLAMNPGGSDLSLNGRETVEPAFGLPAVWISENQRAQAEMGGFTVVDPVTVLITHLGEVIRGFSHEIINRQDMQLLIESVRNISPAVVEELIPNLMSAGEVQKVLQNLLKERIPVRNLSAILEAIADHCRLTKDSDALSEYVRQRMGRTLTRACLHTDGTLYAFTLDPKLEQKIIDSVRQTELGGFAILEPEILNRLIERTKIQVERMSSLGFDPVCLCSPRVRLYYRRLIERLAPRLSVLSYGEIASGIRVESMGMVGF